MAPHNRSASPVIVSESTLLSFVEGAGFEEAVGAQFRELDADKDGLLSRAELCKALECLRLFDDYTGYEERMPPSACGEEEEEHVYDALFKQFDTDGDGVVNEADFASQMREMVLGIARGLRGCPLHMLLDTDSILSHAVQYEEQLLQ